MVILFCFIQFHLFKYSKEVVGTNKLSIQTHQKCFTFISNNTSEGNEM